MLERDIEKYTKDYLCHNFEDIMVRIRRDNVLKLFNDYKPKNILEIGCGMQSIFDFYNDFETFTVIEPSKKICENVLKSKNMNSKISVINDYLENQVDFLRAKSFDFILCSCLLHEVENPKCFLQHIKQICKSKTILRIDVPNSKSFHLLWAYESGLLKHIGDLTNTSIKMQQHSTFDIDSLLQLVQKLGFEVLSKGSYFIKPFNHKKMAELLELEIIDKQLLVGLDNMIKYFPENGAEIFVNCRFSEVENDNY